MWTGRLNSIIEKVFPTLQYTEQTLLSNNPFKKLVALHWKYFPWISNHPARNSCFLANITCRNLKKRTPVFTLGLHFECSLFVSQIQNPLVLKIGNSEYATNCCKFQTQSFLGLNTQQFSIPYKKLGLIVNWKTQWCANNSYMALMRKNWQAMVNILTTFHWNTGFFSDIITIAIFSPLQC